jgi:hypothetical protein
MIKPTVGRVVWYYKYVKGQGHKGPLAALVAFVHSDIFVNLAVSDENGNMRSETSVRLIQENDEAPMQDYCGWMPYQVGQAKKTEAAEAALKEKR